MLSRVLSRWQPITALCRQFCQAPNYRINSEAQKLPSIVRKNDNDLFLTNVKSASSSIELFDVISTKAKPFPAEHAYMILGKLFELQKNEKSSIDPSHVLKNQDFEQLCRSLKNSARTMHLNDVIEALKILTFFGVRSNSEITNNLLNLIKFQINDVGLGQIIFLHFLLRRMDSNPLVDALHLALPILLQIQIGTKMDNENKSQLTDLLIFVSRFRVSDQCTMNIVNALTMHGHDLSFEQATKCIGSLCRSSFPLQNENCDRLLANCIQVMKQDLDKGEFEMISSTLSQMIEKYSSSSSGFYNEALYNACAEFVVNNNLGFLKATFIQRQLNRVSFINMKLLKYMLEEVTCNPHQLNVAPPISVLSLVCALSNANYKPDNWDEFYPLILQSKFLTSEQIYLPWTKFAIELLSLGVECPTLWNKIFSFEFLNQYMDRDDRYIDLIMLLDLYQHTRVLTTYDVDTIDHKYLNQAKRVTVLKENYPLKSDIELTFGGSSYVYTKVRTEMRHVLDHLIVFDKHTKEPVKIADDQNNFGVIYDDVKVDDDTKKSVAVVSFPKSFYCLNMPILRGIHELKVRSFEKLGIPVAVINHDAWTELPTREKIPYIEREVTSKL